MSEKKPCELAGLPCIRERCTYWRDGRCTFGEEENERETGKTEKP